MKTAPITNAERHGVIAVPPLCRTDDGTLDWKENDKLAAYIRAGGVTRLMYGGNAFIYHVTLAEYEALLDWLSGLADDIWALPAVGPSYGRMMDQAALLKRYSFPAAMALPCGDPRDPLGLETGFRRFAEAAGTRVIVYLKDEHNFGVSEAALDALARLVDDGVCVGIKYAVVREDPKQDQYLSALLTRVPKDFVVSGIGERPCIDHWRHFGLRGFTSGSVCVAPSITQQIFEALSREDFGTAESLRSMFIPHEDERDAHGPARVLHASVELAEIARTGPIPPFVTALDASKLAKLGPVAKTLACAAVTQ